MLFYPRSPCGERLGRVNSMLTLIQFSIHALLAESDVEKVPADVFYSAFLSTLSLRRATWQRGSRITYVEFSIHALLAESDAGKHVQPPRPQVFYPRSPCGERPTMTALYRPQVFFYPRSPCGERLVMMEEENMILDFSIHALLAESDAWTGGSNCDDGIFYPRSPCGERRGITHG